MVFSHHPNNPTPHPPQFRSPYLAEMDRKKAYQWIPGGGGGGGGAENRKKSPDERHSERLLKRVHKNGKNKKSPNPVSS